MGDFVPFSCFDGFIRLGLWRLEGGEVVNVQKLLGHFRSSHLYVLENTICYILIDVLIVVPGAPGELSSVSHSLLYP